MLARLHKSMEKRDEGFTLIELLVVMIIIGILAAIAIPVFLSQRAKAQDSATKSDVSTIGKEIATYYVDGAGTGTVTIGTAGYVFTPTTPPTGVVTINMGRASDNITVAAGGVTNIVNDTAWCVGLANSKGANPNWKYSSSAGLTQGSCTGTS